MENCRKCFLFLVLSAFFIASSMSVYAETVEEKKAAANYDETLPTPEEAQVLEKTSRTPQVPPGSQPAVQVTVPSPTQGTPVVMSKTQEAPAESPTPESSSASASQPSKAIASQAVSAASSASLPKGKESPTTKAVQPLPAASQDVSKEMPEDQVFGAAKPSGLVEISGYKYPVFLFAPKDYKTDRTYAMIMIAPAESAKAEKQIEYLMGLAQRKSIFLLAPYVLWPKEGDTPYTLDKWFLSAKKDVMERFPISKKRVYLVGKDLGAHYAAYMAIKYPKEFAAVALLGQAWDGPFAQLIVPRSDAVDQVPFYIALQADGDAQARNQVWFDKLQGRGYPLHFVDYKNDEELDTLEFKKSVFDWMETTGQNWEASVAQSQQTWKGKFKKGVRDFFAV